MISRLSAACVLAFFPSEASSQSPRQPATTAGPESSTEVYGDWALICGGLVNNGNKVCEADLTISVKNPQTQQVANIARVAFASLGKDKPVHVVVQTPTNVTIAPGVALEPEAGKGAISLVYRTCAPAGCFAESDLAADQVKRFREHGAKAQLTITDAAGKAVVLPISLRGFDQAMDAMAKR